MRMAFGLVSVLIAAGLVAYLYVGKSGNDIHTGIKAQEEIQRMTNTGADGMRADQSIKLDPANSDGRLMGMKVTDIVLGGPLQLNFGLKKGDTITRLDGARIGDLDLSDYEMDKAQLFSPHGPDWHITVQRDGQELILPTGK